MKTITLKISEPLSEEIQRVTAETRMSQSELIRTALAEYLKQRRKRRKTSGLDLVRDLVGSVRGPGDLSSNKNYLDDLGE